MSQCTKCNGQGLISTGANPLDLETGAKITCPDCNGSGQLSDEQVNEQADAATGESVPLADGSSDGSTDSQPNQSDEPVVHSQPFQILQDWTADAGTPQEKVFAAGDVIHVSQEFGAELVSSGIAEALPVDNEPAPQVL